ncbi:DNA/RNA non-specific endonuclease [Glutamicibacter creatinolyticus]|uniref:DNA/RNA non-specific endonuclease n=1 Tax=Glutamicibacter TaxID=1742989 RepID=UPI0037C02457
MTTESAALDAPRDGYDKKFLETCIDAPALNPEHLAYSVLVDGSPIINYTHFSLTLSRSRRLARWVGWNIDGGSIKLLDRAGTNFRKDPRLPQRHRWVTGSTATTG